VTETNTIAAIISAILGLLGGLVWMWRLSIVLVRRFDAQDHRLAMQDKVLADIKHEVFPNSGKSLRDAVDTAATEGRANAAELRRLHRKVNRFRRDLQQTPPPKGNHQ
jgi:predicted transcriptional regulator